MTAPLVYTRAEVCGVLKVSLPTVKRLLYSGAIPSVKIGTRRLVRESDLRAYLDSIEPVHVEARP